jgi:hypothetical protein
VQSDNDNIVYNTANFVQQWKNLVWDVLHNPDGSLYTPAQGRIMIDPVNEPDGFNLYWEPKL